MKLSIKSFPELILPTESDKKMHRLLWAALGIWKSIFQIGLLIIHDRVPASSIAR